MTRKRRRIYDAFLSALLDDLSLLLASEIEICNLNYLSYTSKTNVDIESFRIRKVQVTPKPSLGDFGLIPQSELLSTALNYFKARVSNIARSESWSKLCVNDISHTVTPCPAYISAPRNGTNRFQHECQSINHLIEDAGFRSNFLRQVFSTLTSFFYCLILDAIVTRPHKASGVRTWKL